MIHKCIMLTIEKSSTVLNTIIIAFLTVIHFFIVSPCHCNQSLFAIKEYLLYLLLFRIKSNNAIVSPCFLYNVLFYNIGFY